MGKILIVGNWKMHLNASQASLLLHRLQERIRIHNDIEVVLAPSMLTLQPLSLQIDRRKFRLAAQDAYHVDEGPFTGEVSFTMLRDLVHYAIVGHSERRRNFHESLEIVRDKVAAAARNEITPILCVGETKHEHDENESRQVLHDQLMTGLSNLTSAQVRDMVIAYEPVWAIGTGQVAKPAHVERAVKYINSFIEDVFGEKASRGVRVLYGGSVTADVVGGFLEIPGIDGFLVGNASLNYQSFTDIVDAVYKWQRKGEG
ncbi:MAG: triose-phosphate isomerase [Candidatus Saccharimonadales bacterium]